MFRSPTIANEADGADENTHLSGFPQKGLDCLLSQMLPQGLYPE